MVSSNICKGSNRAVPNPSGASPGQVQSLKPGKWKPAKFCRQTYTHMNDIRTTNLDISVSERIFGTNLLWKPTIRPETISIRGDIPAAFDLSTQCRFASSCIDHGFDRELCGNDWATAVAVAIGDQYALQFDLNYVPQISASHLTSLFTDDKKDGCVCKVSLCDVAKLISQGSSPTPNPSSGAMLRSCWPETLITNFVSSDTGANTSTKAKDMEKLNGCCWNCCDGNIRSNSIFMVNSMYPIYVEHNNKVVAATTQEQIRIRLLNHQPVCTSFCVTESFIKYWFASSRDRHPWTPDVVDPDSVTEDSKGVSCTIIGYGVDKNKPYWVIQTSMRRSDSSFVGAVYASTGGKGNGLDFPLVKLDGTYVGGPWALTLVDKFVPGIHNTDYPVYRDATNFSARKNINWLYVTGILLVGLAIVLMIVFLM